MLSKEQIDSEAEKSIVAAFVNSMVHWGELRKATKRQLKKAYFYEDAKSTLTNTADFCAICLHVKHKCPECPLSQVFSCDDEGSIWVSAQDILSDYVESDLPVRSEWRMVCEEMIRFLGKLLIEEILHKK